MTIRITEIDKQDLTLFNVFSKWEANPLIKPFIMPRMTEEEVPDFSGEELMDHANKNNTKHIYVMYDDNKPIGISSIDTAFTFLKSNKDKVAWISVLIGETDYLGKGLSKVMMKALEHSARALGCLSIELGVFDYNEKAKNLYKSMGYETLCIIENFVYHNNQWHDDIRMFKEL